MIWWDIKTLERKIIENQYSDREAFYYFLVFSIGVTLVGYINSTNEGLVTFVQASLGVVITIVGSFLIFKINEAGDGKEFFKRFLGLYWVIGIRLFVVFMVLMVLGTIVWRVFYAEQSVTDDQRLWLVTIFITVYSIAEYYYLYRSFKKVSHYSSDKKRDLFR